MLIRCIPIALAMLLVSGCATALLGTGRVSFSDTGMSHGVTISEHDRNRIDAWYRDHGGEPGPGLVPPGLVRMDTLPRALHGRALPRALERELSALPLGYVRLVIGHDIVLLRRDDHTVIDLYRDAVP